MVTRITNGKLITSSGVLNGYALYFEGNKIIDITANEKPFDCEIDAKGNYVSAGFIDVHVHGGGGYDFMDGGVEPIINAANFHLRTGTTSIMPTSLACSTEVLLEFLKDLRKAKRSEKLLPNIIGAHLEGPYFSHAQAGAQNPDYIINPNPKDYEMILREYGDIISCWSFAPELEGSEEFCEALVAANVKASVGHSDAVFSSVKAVYDKGCRKVTHLYSGMSTITRHDGYRKLGVIESAYLLDDMVVEIIADGKHLPAELLKLIVKCKGANKICLVTDAMRAAGTTVKESMLGRLGECTPCIIEDGIAKLPDRTSFAGSVATADRLVRTMVKEAGVDIETAVAMITAVPAEFFGITNKGALKVGYDADIVVFDENIEIKNVIIGGKQIGN